MRSVRGVVWWLSAGLSAMLVMALPGGTSGGGPARAGEGSAPTIVAAGDIACESEPCASQEQTAQLIDDLDPTAVLTLGDNQYPDGELSDFQASYDPTWGRFLERTRPSPGNHDYHTDGADGYFQYFGRRAHRKAGGYYSFNIGAWHVLALNSGDGISDEQVQWVSNDLSDDDHLCELAYWHHPRWSSGENHGSNDSIGPLWEALYAAGVDVVLNGHEHNYERFAPLNPSGQRDPETGIREFVAGTGGKSLYPLGDGINGSQKRIDSSFGVLSMTLRLKRYEWAFVATDGSTLDSGSKRCHA